MISSVAARRARPDEARAVAAQVERRAEPHRDGPHPGELRADRLDLLGADEAHRHDGGAGLEGEPRHARAAAVQAAVERAGALGVERERRAGLEDATALRRAPPAPARPRPGRRCTAPIAVKNVRDTQPENPVPVK